jgi:hypothetical protein
MNMLLLLLRAGFFKNQFKKSQVSLKFAIIQLLLLVCGGMIYAQADLALCRIKNLSSGKYLSIQSASTGNGAKVVQATNNGSNAFLWTLTYNSAGYYTLTNVNSGKMVTLPGGNQVSGTVPEQQQSTGGAGEQWKFKPVGANAYIIQSNMSNGYVLTNPVDSTEGGLMNINAYNGSAIQQWVIESTVANANSYAANSTNLVFSTPSNAILKMLKTKISLSAYNSYFETLTFTNGYAGLQLSSDGHWGSNYISISSLWDPAGGGVSNAEYVAPGVTAIHGDHGEGSATTTIAPFNWQYNVWYNIVVRTWERDGKLHLGTFINNLSDNTWFHQTTITTTNDGTFLGSGEASFIENWAAGDATISANNVRKAFYKDCWNINTSGTWEKPTSGYVSCNRSAASASRAGIWDASFDGGYDVTEGAYYMQTGGLTRRNPGFGSADYTNLPLQPGQGSVPVLTVGTVNSVTLSYSNGQAMVNWINDNTKSPQLFSNAEILDANGNVIMTSQETLPQKRSATFNTALTPGATYTARVTIIDIFNQQSAPKTSVTFTIPAGTIKGCVGGSLQISATTANATGYQWQYQNANSSWSNYPEGVVPGYATFTGTQTATMTVSNISAYYIDHPNTVRAKITLTNGSVIYSTIQQWQAQGITQQPANASACASGTLQVSATASGNAYQWQYQNANGSWSNYPEGAVSGYATFTNTTTPVMTISNISSYYITHPNQARLVVYGANGCSVNSNTITWAASSCSQTMNGVGKWGLENSDQIQVYPNPVQDELNISTTGTSASQVEISNTVGQIIYKASTSGRTIKIPFRDKAPGIYFVKVADAQSKESKTFSVVKQ